MATNVSYLVDTASAGDEYETFAAWWTAIDSDLVTAGNIEKLVIQKSGNHWESGGILLDGKTTDATNYVWITVDAAYRHDGLQKNGFYIEGNPGLNLAAFRIDSDYALIEYLDIENTRAQGSAFAFHTETSGVVFKACIGESTTSSYAFNAGCPDEVWPEFHACLAVGGYIGFGRRANARKKLITYNCSAVNCTYGFDGQGSTEDIVAINCVAYNSATEDWYGTYWDASCDYNATSDTSTAPGTNSITGITSADFEDAANDDWHIDPTGSLFNAGTSLSSDVDYDIDGDAFTFWAIGHDYTDDTTATAFSMSTSDAVDSLSGSITTVDSIDFSGAIGESSIDTFTGVVLAAGSDIPFLTDITIKNITSGQYDVYIDLTYPNPGGDEIFNSTDLVVDNWLDNNDAVIVDATHFTLDDRLSSNITSQSFAIENGYTYNIDVTLAAVSGTQSFLFEFIDFSGNTVFLSESKTATTTATTFELNFFASGITATSGRVRIKNTDYVIRDFVFTSAVVSEVLGGG